MKELLEDYAESYHPEHEYNDSYRQQNLSETLALIAEIESAPHPHYWQLAKYIDSKPEHVRLYYRGKPSITEPATPAVAHFVCECGEFKTVEEKV